MFGEEYCIDGCYFVDLSKQNKGNNATISTIKPISVEIFNIDDFGIESNQLDQIPEILVDPETFLLTLVNSHTSLHKSFVLTFTNEAIPLKNIDMSLKTMKTTDGNSNVECTTLLSILPPKTTVDTIFLNNLLSEESIFSDVRLVLSIPQEIHDLKPISVGFPLEKVDINPVFKCIQGFGGCFTHYMKDNYYSIDLLCNEGTNIVSCLPGKVIIVQDQFKSKGCHVNNFYKCNRITIQHEDSIISEYVHLNFDSSLVKVGDFVKKGSKIAKSGNSGFSPVPHLHFQITQGNNCIPFIFDNKLIKLNQYY